MYIDFQDNGHGMSEESHLHAFEPFYTTNRNTGCIGLGLSIIYNLVNLQLAGTIQLMRTQAGTHFSLQLPVIAPRIKPTT